MKGREKGDPLKVEKGSPQGADSLAQARQPFECRRPQRDDHFRLDDGDLLSQIGAYKRCTTLIGTL